MSHRPRDNGYTLVEVLTAMSLMSILMAIAVGGWSAWSRSSEHAGTAREIQAVMRQAQQRAVTEGSATCVWFDDATDSYTVFRGSCSDSSRVKVSGPVKAPGEVHIDSPEFSQGGGPSAGASFQARGTGSPGDVTVTRADSSKTYVLSVDWLTGRVSLS